VKLKTLFIIARVLLVLYLLLWVVVYTGQTSIVFQPEYLPNDFEYEFDADFKEGYIETSDKVPLNYLHFKTNQERKGLILYFHGNSLNLHFWGNAHSDFTKRGYDVFMIDYRGYGKSEGELSELKMYEDARMVYEHLMQKYSPEETIIYGRSLGTAVASNLATKVPAKHLVLETPYKSMQSLFLDQVMILWLPFDLKYQFANNKNIPKVPYPTTIIHGTEDLVVPYRNAIRLQDVLKADDEFITIEDGEHKNLSEFPLFQQTLDRILLPVIDSLMIGNSLDTTVNLKANSIIKEEQLVQ